MKNIFLLLIIPFLGFSQSEKKIFIESGVSIFKPFKNQGIKNETQLLKYTYKTTQSFYCRVGFETIPETEKLWSLSLPFSLGYREQKISVIREGTALYYSDGIERYDITSAYYS